MQAKQTDEDVVLGGLLQLMQMILSVRP